VELYLIGELGVKARAADQPAEPTPKFSQE